jgi:hypothetical protein
MAARSRAGGVEQLHDLVGEAAGVLLGQRDPGEEPGQRHGDDGGGTPFGRRVAVGGCGDLVCMAAPLRLGRGRDHGVDACSVGREGRAQGRPPWPRRRPLVDPAEHPALGRRQAPPGQHGPRPGGVAALQQAVAQAVPSVRSRLVRAMPRWPRGGFLSTVSSWTTASARRPLTARSRPSRSRASAITGVTPSASRRRPAPGIAGQAEHLVAMGDELAVDGVGDGVQPAGHGESGQGDQQAVGPEQGQQHRDAEARVIWFPKVGNSSSDWAM